MVSDLTTCQTTLVGVVCGRRSASTNQEPLRRFLEMTLKGVILGGGGRGDEVIMMTIMIDISNIVRYLHCR